MVVRNEFVVFFCLFVVVRLLFCFILFLLNEYVHTHTFIGEYRKMCSIWCGLVLNMHIAHCFCWLRQKWKRKHGKSSLKFMAPSIEFVIRIVFMRIKSRMKNCMSVMQPDVVYNMYALQPASQHSTYYIIPIYLCALIQFFSVFRLFYFFIPSFLLILRVFGQNTFIFDWIRMKVDYCGAIVSGKTPSRN